MDYSKMIETFKGVACVITQKKTGAAGFCGRCPL